VTRAELDILLDQQQPRDEEAFSGALGAATTLLRHFFRLTSVAHRGKPQ
jgi:hypothetical protein